MKIKIAQEIITHTHGIHRMTVDEDADKEDRTQRK